MRIRRYDTSWNRPQGRLEKYFRNIQQDLKLFFFLLFLLCLYRVVFLGMLANFMGSDVGAGDILQANWTGLRLSLKSAGGFTLLSFVLVTLPGILNPRWSWEKLRLGIGTAASFLLAVLFEARFPYYEEFHMTYGLQVMQGVHDDRSALFMTMVQEYGLPWRLAIAIVLTGISWYVLRALLTRVGTAALPSLARSRQILTMLMLFLVTVSFAFVTRFGGGVSYATGINWENAGVTKDEFLNECILDDVQGMYRAIQSEKRMKAGAVYGVNKDKVREMAERAAQLNGNTAASGDDICPYLVRQAPGAKIAKPKHIFIILGETWAQWPMLEKYEQLHAADGIKSLAHSPQGYYTQSFMPNGDFTSIAITGMITGLSEVNVRANYQPRSFKEIYPTAMAPQFKELGYQVDFWYGGTPSWDNIKKLALAQGFDHFYGYPDYQAPKTNTWGTNDRNLFAAMEKSLGDEPPTVHLIMTTSNHPPYNVDVAAEGFDLEKAKAVVREIIPDASDPDTLALEIGHYWYMDKVVTEFVNETMAKYPDSLFVITGDHAVRTNPGPKPSLFEFQSVPFVLYGQGVTKDILPANAVGGHTGIAPTLINLIAPQGFTYHAIAPAIGETPVAFNRGYWLNNQVMGQVEGGQTEPLPGASGGDAAAGRSQLDTYLPMMRTLSWWLLEKGTTMN